uniref:Cadherin domain-containing protein n=1 Tax=Lutzomyia longipalpis TaxID=7200 RepID=A0A1B0CLN1_LUTLO
VTVADNRKPAFRDCKGYAPSVKEEQAPGTFVLKVEADDPDEKDIIEYSFVTAASERPKFRIDSKTGVIVTSYTFDRDEPIREKEVYVTVRATDNGRPPLDDVCTFKVTIEDINDNPPVFDKAKYEESMSEDIQVNRVVMRISASDFDDGDNSIVKPIDRKPGQYYSMNVRAYNIINDQPQDAQIEVKIRVIESNKKPPTFINPPTEPIYLNENFSDYSKSLVVLKAQSNVPDKPEVIFELITGRTEQTNSKKTFVFTQGEDDVSITLGKALDYEAITDYTLTMSVKNTYDLVAEHLIKIKVKDVNDNIPYFTEVTTGTISENEPPGTPVMQVRAFDMDGTSANNIVSFELADNTDIFAIDSSTGNITALTTFDREERDFYNVKVIATDNSPSSLYNTGQHNMGQQVFRIEIADKNDHRPHFTRDEYISDKVAEDANINFLVIEVTAEDADAASQITYTIFIKYFIVKSEQQHLLAIDNDGCLRLIQPLDRDEPNGHKNWQVIVAAVDENREENRQPGNIVTLKAKDYDEPHNGPPFHYEIDQNAPEDIKRKFGITGDILIAMDIFDREEQKEYMIPILISDSGEPTMRNPYKESLQQREALNEVPDIGGFLVGKKDSCDKDNDAHPVDDVRYYAYEGDGNSTGSLSSLASCTDDGDLKFDYLSNFGPRFRKLADIDNAVCTAA